MFSMATVKLGFGLPSRPNTGRPFSRAFLLNASSCAPLKKPPPNPVVRSDAKLSVLIHVDVKRLHYQKAEGRNNNALTIATALFDHDGRFISGNEKILNMHLKGDTLAHKLDPGVTVKSGFDVKAGSYLVRLVLRDAQGLLSGESAAVEIL